MNPLHAIHRECLNFAMYYAPRGRPRLMLLGDTLAQRYLQPTDQLIGILGEAGIGKSSVVSGLFPGLELTNDDAGVNVHPPPLIRDSREGRFRVKTYHVDIRFESGFTQPWEIADAIRAALKNGRRVVAEHFDVIYPLLKINAQVLVGLGEDLIITRPNVFGPHPADVLKSIEGTGVFRKMAHTAEDLTSLVLSKCYGYSQPVWHSDVPRGFVIEFSDQPDIDLDFVEREVRALIAAALPVSYEDGNHIRVGETVYPCSGPRVHVPQTSEVRNYRIFKQLIHDELHERYLLVGQVAEPRTDGFPQRVPGLALDTLPDHLKADSTAG